MHPWTITGNFGNKFHRWCSFSALHTTGKCATRTQLSQVGNWQAQSCVLLHSRISLKQGLNPAYLRYQWWNPKRITNAIEFMRFYVIVEKSCRVHMTAIEVLQHSNICDLITGHHHSSDCHLWILDSFLDFAAICCFAQLNARCPPWNWGHDHLNPLQHKIS